MRELFRDYGSAIGPTFAFLLGILALAIKNAFDRLVARSEAERRVKRIAEIMTMSPPPPFQGPIDALTNVKFVMANAVNMSKFYDRMAAVKGAIDAADKPVHEHGRPHTIIKFDKMRLQFDIIMKERDFFQKSPGSSDLPRQENFFNVQQSWEALIEAASIEEKALSYQILSDE